MTRSSESGFASFGTLAFGLLLALVVSIVLSIFLPRLLAGPTGKTEEVVITNQGEYRIANYERFYTLKEDIDALDVKLSIYPEGPLDGREATECRGLLATRANLVAEYNAASKAVRTSGQWRADNLPSELPQEQPRRC